jgi:hypothetical protein
MPVALITQPVYNGYSTTMRLVDISGNTLYSADSFSSAKLTSLDLGYPTIRAVTVPISGAHGQTDTTQWFGDRAITAELTMPERPWTDSAVDALAGLMDPSQRLWLYVQRPNWPSERRILIRPATFVCPPGLVRKAQAGWIAPAGLLEAAAAVQVSLQPQQAGTGGVAIPLAIPMVLSAGLAPGAALVNVDGNTNVPPTIDIYGPCSDPLVRCVTTGRQVSFAGFSIAAGDYLHVDMAARTVTLNGDPSQSRYNRRDLSTSSWWSLPAGTGVQVAFSATGPSAPCQAVVSWRPRFI